MDGLKSGMAEVACQAAQIAEEAGQLSHGQPVTSGSAPTGAWDMLRSPIMFMSLLCSVICCACGLAVFLVLNAHEEQKARQQAEAASGSREGPDPKPLGSALPVPADAAEPQKTEMAAPETPTAAPRPPITPAVDSEDGSSVQIELLPSTQLPEHIPAEAVPLSTGASFRVLGVIGTERGPLTAVVPDGEHNYVWDDRSEYFGEWREGCAHGRGVFSWPSGDRYEGEWEQGRENGVGTYIAVDGSTFYGFWSDGKMNGEGVYKPATADNQRAEVMFMREYNHGKLVKETVLRVKDYDYHRKELKRDQRARKSEKRQAAREMMAAPRSGETIYKGHRSYDLMRNLQIGILFSIAKTNREISEREVNPRPEDYKQQVTQQFPRSGQSTSFKWKDYSPLIFHRLREAFGIDNRDYLLSLTGDKALRELPSPGKSGSVFFISDDDRFMIKTVRKEEMQLLLELVPTYYTHCLDNPETLLTRFYGVHRVKPINGHHVRFVVMGNVFPTETRLHRRYDLKGSTYGRTAGVKLTDPNATLKDLDVDFRLQLKHVYHDQLMRQIQADAALLERMHVMDYSLLLGIHYVEWGSSWYPPHSEVLRRGQQDADELEEGDSPTGSERNQQLTWSAEFAAAELDAGKDSPHKAIFNKWHSQRRCELDEPGPCPENSESGSRGERGCTPPTTSEVEPASPSSSVSTSISTSMASTSGHSGFRKSGSVEDLQARYRESVAIHAPSGSWPAMSPLRPTRFAMESRPLSAANPQTSPFAQQLRPALKTNGPAQLPLVPSVMMNPSPSRTPTALQVPPNTPAVRSGRGDVVLRAAAGGSPTAESPKILAAGEAHTPRFQQLLSRVQIRDDRKSPDSSALERTRSGWLKDQGEGTSLRSLHSEARRHMGVSIPALAFPLKRDGSADVDARPEPVTLFFGIIDFLQDYNMRKRTEHMIKSIVQDGKAISVTNPHTYSQRFIRHMHTLFIPVSSE